MPILTTPFEDVLDRILAYYRTDAPMPHITIEHPIQNIEPAVLEERAQQIASAIVALLDSRPDDQAAGAELPHQ